MVVLFTKIIRENLWGVGSGIGDAELWVESKTKT